MKTHWYKRKKSSGQTKDATKEYKSVMFVLPTKDLKKIYEESMRKKIYEETM